MSGADGTPVPAIRDLVLEVQSAKHDGADGPVRLRQDHAAAHRRRPRRSTSPARCMCPTTRASASCFRSRGCFPGAPCGRISSSSPRTCRTRSSSISPRAVDIADMLPRYPQELSLGLARRVALARAFAPRPDLLLLDEPFVSLDERTADRLRRLLLEVWSARPTTAILVTHNPREAILLADQLVLLAPRPTHVVAVVPIPVPQGRARRGDGRGDLRRSAQAPSRPISPPAEPASRGCARRAALRC